MATSDVVDARGHFWPGPVCPFTSDDQDFGLGVSVSRAPNGDGPYVYIFWSRNGEGAGCFFDPAGAR
jgi:hypothetical protein